jgi:hypothetical protein
MKYSTNFILPTELIQNKLKTSALLAIFLAIIQVSSIAQCIDRAKITYGGDWGFVEYIHRCPTYNFAYGGDTSKNWNVLGDPIEINQAPKEVLGIKQKVEKEMRSFSGEAFYSRVKFNSVEIVYPDMLQPFMDSGRQDVTLEYCKAKYFFYYEFLPDSLASYHIGVGVDNRGKILNRFNFPAKQFNKSIDTTYTYCSLISLARALQPNIEPIKDIKLEYDKSTKRFYWLISQEVVDLKEGWNYFHQVLIDANDHSQAKEGVGRVSVVF